MAGVRYWHGGGRIQGDWVLPASETGARTLADYATDAGVDSAHMARDRVFLTTEYQAAVLFAAGADVPWVYECEPDGALERDPDYLLDDGGSVQCPRARILRRYKPARQEVALALSILRDLHDAL